jgi:hypothetical protein
MKIAYSPIINNLYEYQEFQENIKWVMQKTNSIWFIYSSRKILAKYLLFGKHMEDMGEFWFDEKGYANQRQFSIPGPNLTMRMPPGLP